MIENRNLILAIVLSVAILFGFEYYNKLTAPPPPPPGTETAAGTQTPGAPAATTPTPTAPGDSAQI
ncbi:MAG: membrane protein insertase YidC, partial [Rhodospirillaceae bacterium]